MKNRIIFICFLSISILIMFLYQQSQEKYDKGYADYFKPEKQLTEEEKNWLSSHDKLVFGADAHFAPLGFENQGQYDGFLADYLDKLSEKLGKKIKVKFIENSEIKESLISGEIDFAIMTYSLDKKQYADFTLPIIKAKGVLCTKKISGIKEIHHINSNNRIIGVNIFEDISEQTKENIHFISVDHYKNGIEALENEEADGIIGEETVIAYYLKKKGIYSRYYFSPISVYEKNYVFGVYNENEILQGVLNKTVQNIALDGNIRGLQLKWFGLSSSLVHENISDRIAMIMLIIFTAIAAIFYYFYEANKNLYSELEKRMELLTISKNDLQTTFDGVSYLMIEVNKDRQILNGNRAFCRELEMKRNEIIGKKLYDIFKVNKNMRIMMDNVIKATFDLGKEGRAEINYDGNIYELSTFSLRDAKDRIQKVLIMLNDVSRARAAERQMIQDNKMIAVGQLAAGVAHEIRNPLGLIRNYSYILRNESAYNEEMRNKALDVIEKAVEKSGSIINNLLNFSRISNNKCQEVHLYTFFNSIVFLENNLLERSGIRVKLDCNSDLKIYTINESLEIIIINLISNAVDAIKGKGNIHITCHSVRDVIIIKFSDDGEGIAPENIENIFNPFFTTKKSGKGTGLGLYIVYNEVQKLGGDIQVDSQLGEGTQFIITLPNKRGDDDDE